MPSDFAHKITGQGGTKPELVEFDETATVKVLPRGRYVGSVVPESNFLGNNGAGLVWKFVKIVEAPDGAKDWVGRSVNIRLRETIAPVGTTIDGPDINMSDWKPDALNGD